MLIAFLFTKMCKNLDEKQRFNHVQAKNTLQNAKLCCLHVVKEQSFRISIKIKVNYILANCFKEKIEIKK